MQLVSCSKSKLTIQAYEGYTLISCLYISSSADSIVLAVGNQHGKYAAKLLSFERALMESEADVPDEVRILGILEGKHHTIQMVEHKVWAMVKRSCLILPFIDGHQEITSYRKLWDYLSQLLEV
jgi:hypothetical protein